MWQANRQRPVSPWTHTSLCAAGRSPSKGLIMASERCVWRWRQNVIALGLALAMGRAAGRPTIRGWALQDVAACCKVDARIDAGSLWTGQTSLSLSLTHTHSQVLTRAFDNDYERRLSIVLSSFEADAHAHAALSLATRSHSPFTSGYSLGCLTIVPTV